MTAWAVLVAAGSGSRFGGPKHAVSLRGRPMWEWSAAVLHAAGVDDVVVVGDVPGGVPGGARRRDSVAAGLARVPDTVEHVLVHDAARPAVSVDVVTRVLEALAAGAEAVVPAVPVRDTVKSVRDSVVVVTIDRGDLVQVQTPQGFRASLLRAAHAAGEDDVTDDAALVEAIGGKVTVVAGDPRNMKVTFPEDVDLVAALLGTS